MKASAIIVAAGSGLRSGSSIPKQFVEINHRPLFLYTLDKFLKTPTVSEIVVVAASEWLDYVQTTLPPTQTPVTVVAGGKTRAESVCNGMSAISEDAEVVAIHDAARPFVRVEDIQATLEKAWETGAACLVSYLADTIKTITAGEITATLDRSRIRRALTPQAFRPEVIRRAFDGIDFSENIPDDCYLVERLGHPIAAVETSALNLKVTYPEDLVLAKALIEAGL